MNKFEKMMVDLDQVSEILGRDSDNSELVTYQASVDRAVDILHKLEQWTNAYPTNIFPVMSVEDWAEHHKILKSARRSGTAAAADSMRHIVRGFAKVLHE